MTGVAVIGTGFGCLTHVRALRNAGLDVRALVGRDLEKTRVRAKRFDVPLALGSVDDAVSSPGIDAVTIATPPHTHAEIALAAIAAGKHVVCEKPFTRDAIEARKVYDAATAAGVVHLLGCEFRFAGAQALMARLVADGALGAPRLATFLLHIPLLAYPNSEVPQWWSSADQGGGWLGAQGSHVIDQVRSTLGEFAGVSGALANIADHGWSAEDTFSVRFRTAGGCDGVMQSTASDFGPIIMQARIAGSKGTVWAEGDRVQLADATGARDVPIPDDLMTLPADPPPSDLLVTSYDLLHSTGLDMGPYTRLFETFRDLIDGRPIDHRPAPATFADGVAAMDVLDAIRQSAAEQSWITIGT
jgi:predicted dehydrogenase